jgi:hypothetical protein
MPIYSSAKILFGSRREKGVLHCDVPKQEIGNVGNLICPLEKKKLGGVNTDAGYV